MSYVLKRLAALGRTLLTPRAVLIAIASVSGLVALFAPTTLRVVAYLVAALSLGMAILLTAARQREQHQRIVTMQGKLLKAEEAINKLGGRSAPTNSAQQLVGPSGSPQTEARLETAKQMIATTRATLGLAHSDREFDELATSPDRIPTDNSSPVVTIVVPLYNEERYISDALESVRAQTFADWECVVVDDASTDRSLVEAWRYAAADHRFRIIRHKANGGLSAARNTGLRAARGRFVAFLDADDMLMADNLVDRLEALRSADADAAGSYGGVQIVPADTTLDSLPDHSQWTKRREIDFLTVRGECPFNAHAPLLRTAVVRDHGGFNEHMRHGAEDWDLWLRIMRSGYTFVPAKNKTAVYRQKTASMAKKLAFEHVVEARRLISESYSAAPPSSAIPPSHPFPEPLPVYLEIVTLARRAIEFSSMALLQADQASATKILEALPAGTWPLITRHLDVNDIVTRAFHRVLGLGTDSLDRLGFELKAPLEMIGEMVRAATGGSSARPQFLPRPSFEIALVPQNAAQARSMIDSVSELPADEAFAFILTDRITGEQGAGPILRGSSYPVFSLNEWVLGGFTHQRLVVMFPYEGAVEELIALTERGGGEVLYVRAPGEDVLRAGDAPEPPAFQVNLIDLGLRLRTEGDGKALLLAKPRSAGPMMWAPSDDDPDRAYVFEETPQNPFDTHDMMRFENLHAGERCVIIGNGPSLNKLDLHKLSREYTIGVNGIFYAADNMGFDLSYYVVEDTMVIRDNLDAIREYRAGHKFFPSIYRSQVGEGHDITYFMMNRGFYAPKSPAFCVPRFSTNPGQRLYSGQSVTIINLQLAYFMGFEKVVLIGMDFSYTVPDDAEIASDGIHITSMGDDPNHFHPDYFGEGKVWKDPKLDRVLANYQLAKIIYESDGRQIVNATPGGNLALFERVDYDSMFS